MIRLGGGTGVIEKAISVQTKIHKDIYKQNYVETVACNDEDGWNVCIQLLVWL